MKERLLKKKNIPWGNYVFQLNYKANIGYIALYKFQVYN